MTAFGPFRLDQDRRQLIRAGAAVTLSSRAFDILVLLVEHRGRVVTKDEIMAAVWRGMIVEENNLAVQISALRRALADGEAGTQFILTVPGQGYRFVGRLCDRDAEAAQAVVNLASPLPAIAIPATPDAAQIQPAPVAAARAMPVWRSPFIVAALAACVLGLAGVELLRHGTAPPVPASSRPAAPPRLSIAVLPFRNLSDDRCCDYLADAISDDLTTDLSHIPGSVVIARESSDMFRGHPAPAGEIGRALNVRYLLEGSLRAVDGQFSINAQLIEAATGGHLWAERFTVPRAHLADAQDSIVKRLASALGVKLVDIEGANSVRERPDNPDALDLFLRARSILDRADSLDALSQAQALLEQAMAKQPDDVKALSELGWLLPRKINNFVTAHREADLAEARNVTARALALAPRDPAVLAAKASLQAYDGHCGDAQLTYQAALEGEPDSVRALTGLTVCKFQLGQFGDAVTSLGALLRIDPDGPRQKSRFYQMGFAELMMDRPAEALPWLHRAIAGEADPVPGAPSLTPVEWARLSLIAASGLAGDRADAAEAFAAHRRIWPYRSTWTLESRSPRSFSALPGFRHFLSALEQAGMPRFVDERAGPVQGQCGDGLEPTPHAVAGTQTIDTAALSAMLKGGKPVVADFGVGAAVPPGVGLSPLDPQSGPDMAKLSAMAAGGPIVTMGSSMLDPRGCQAASLLAGRGRTVFWYRGGEEAWAAAGLNATDAR
jgi:TolB-like protein/DNA-binding winged helix-turn-helix (wHTH) protein/Tfp pilus assembly protein PilF